MSEAPTDPSPIRAEKPAEGRAEGPEPVEAALTVRRVPQAWLDRPLPETPAAFLGCVAAVAAAVWLIGLALAPNAAAYLASREWQAQPIYLAVHLVVLRLFVTSYARNFLAGCHHLTTSREEAERRVRSALGPRALAGAVVLAAPLALLDWIHLFGGGHVEAGDALGGKLLAPVDVWAGVVWTAEWVINAYVWAVLLGFLWHTMRVLSRHRFVEPIEVMLRKRRYRPFLLMSAQGASILLVFAIASGAYVWYADGVTSDYAALWVSAGLLLLGFVPPWLKLKSDVSDVVDAEAERLGEEVETSNARVAAVDDGRPEVSLDEIGARVDVALAMLRIEHLERLYAGLGKNEGRAIVLRLLAPLGTALWRFVKPF